MNFTILRFDTLASTNTEAISQAKRGADEGLCVVAERQTAGRGRRGRNWISEKGAGLYFSIVLRPAIETKYLPLLTLMTAIVVHDTLENLWRIKSDIKWANDVHVGGKKICGILAEMTETPQNPAIVVGIGINLTPANFPEEIAAAATSVEAETNRKIETSELLPTLTAIFSRFYDILQSPGGAKTIVDEWTRRSTYACGKAVRVGLADETFDGTTDGLAENGALRVITAAGKLKIVQAGDVTQLRAEDAAIEKSV